MSNPVFGEILVFGAWHGADPRDDPNEQLEAARKALRDMRYEFDGKPSDVPVFEVTEVAEGGYMPIRAKASWKYGTPWETYLWEVSETSPDCFIVVESAKEWASWSYVLQGGKVVAGTEGIEVGLTPTGKRESA